MEAKTIQTPHIIDESYDKIKITNITFYVPIDSSAKSVAMIEAVYCKEVDGVLVPSDDPDHKIIVDSNAPGVGVVLNTFIDAAYALVVAQTGDVIV